MNYMIKNIAAKVISYFFGQYIDQIDSSQLELEIWNGKARLENLKITQNAFASHDLPFTVTNGTIGSISFVFPWGRLNSEPCIIEVENVYIVASISSSVIISKDIETKREVEKLHQSENSVSESGGLSSILSQIIDNLQFLIRNVHIRIELDDSIVAFGLAISSIKTFSVDEKLDYAFIPTNSPVLRKKVELSDLSIYIDPNQKPIPIENFSDHMQKLIYYTHHYILRPFSFSCHILIHRKISPENVEGEENSIEVDAVTKSINLALDEIQMKALFELEKQYTMFNTRRKYSHCGKPDDLPQEDDSCLKWWRYSHRCAIEKKNKISFDPKNALNILVNRKKYVEIVNSGCCENVQNFEKNFDLPVVIFLRNYANGIKETSAGGVKLLPEEIEAVIEVQKKTKNQKMKLIFKTGILAISFLNKKMTPIARLLINEIESYCSKDDTNSNIELSIKSMTVYNEMSKKFNKVLNSKDGTKIIIKSSLDKPKSIDVESSGTTFIADLNFFNQIVEFFAKERKKVFIEEDEEKNSKAKIQIQTIIDRYKGLDLNININNTSIILPYQKQDECYLVMLHIQKTNVTSKPNSSLNADDFSTLYDNYTIKFEDSMLYLDEKPLLSQKFNCNLNVNLAIVESNKFDNIQVMCLFDRIHAHISTIQFLIIENFILYIVNEIFYLFLDETEKLSINSYESLTYDEKMKIKLEKNLQLKHDLMKSKNASKIVFILKIKKIDFSLCLQTSKIFEFLSDNFEMNCLIGQFFLLQIILKNLTGYEFVTSQETKSNYENNKFAYFEEIKFNFTNEDKEEPARKELINKMGLYINNSIVYAKQKCLLYLIELLTDPDRFEKVFDNNESYDYSKIQYQMNVPSYTFSCININLINTRVYLSNDKNIGNIIIKSFDFIANINTSWNVDINIIDCLLKNENQLIEVMDKTTVNANSKLLKFQRINSIVFILNFDYVMTLIDYLSNLTLPKIKNKNEEKVIDTYYSLKNMDIDIRSIIGSFNELNFKVNDIELKGKMPINLNFNLGLVDILLDKISIANIQNVSILSENEFIDQSLVDDLNNLEKNKLFAKELIESKPLSTKQFMIYSSKVDIKVNSVSFTIIPAIMRVLPPVEKLSKSLGNKNEETDYDDKQMIKSSPKYETNHIISFELNTFSFSFLEDKKNLLSLNLGQFLYKDHIIKLNQFSILSDGYDPIAICKENFFYCSDSLKFIQIQDIDFILDCNMFLTLAKSLMQFSPILSYISLIKNEKSDKEIEDSEDNNNNNNDDDDNDNDSEDTKMKEVDARFNKFSFLIKDKDASICLTIAINARENHFEINDLAINFIMGELSLPILQPVTIKFDFSSKRTNIKVSPINFIIIIGVINFVTSLSQKFSPLFNNKNAIQQDDYHMKSGKESNISSSLSKKIQILPINMNIMLCFNDRTPFVTFKVETSKVLLTNKFTSQLQLSIDYFNPETGNNDLILEPLNISTKATAKENSKSIRIKTTQIILNIHIPFIKRLIYFNHYRKKQIKLNHLIYKFVNKMQTTISLTVGDVIHKNINPGQSVPFNDVDLNTSITVEYNTFCEKFVLNQIFYPTALSSTCFIYRENNKIMICSPYFIENNLNLPITVYSSNYIKINRIQPHTRIPFPTEIDIKQGLYFVYGELESNNELGGNIEANKAISIGSIMNCSNENSIETLFAKRSPANNNEPKLFKLGSWTSSDPVVQNILDNIYNESSKDIVAFIYQKIEREIIGIIEIAPILIIVNELPYDLKFYIDGFNSEYSLASGDSFIFPFNTKNYNTESKIVCQFETKMHGDSAQTTISYKDNSKTEIILKNSLTKKVLSITAHAILTSGQTKLYIYSPAILCNKCGFPLNYRKINDSKPSILYDYTLLGSQSYVENSTLNIQIQCEQFHSEWQKEKIDCTAIGISSTIFLPTSNESIFVPIHVHNHKATEPFNHTTIVDFSSALVFVNETKHHFILSPSTKDKQFWLKVDPYSRIRVCYTTKSSQFIVKVKDIKKSIKIILASPTRKVFRINNIYIEMETVLFNGILCCNFREALIPSPIVFTNLLDNPFHVYQVDSENPIVVQSNSTSLFAYDDPFGDDSVVIDFGSQKIKVQLNSNCEPTEIKETGFFIEIKTAGKDHRMLIISKHSIAINYDTSFYFSLSIQDILISLITQSMMELCLISFHHLRFKTSNEGSNSLYELILDSFQIDDQLNIAPFSTFLIGSSNEKTKFLHLSAICYRDATLFTSFKNFTFSMQKLLIYADMAFISDMYGFYEEIHKSIKKMNDKKIKLDYGSDYCQVKSTILLLQNDEEMKAKKHTEKLISFSSLILHPFLATVTYRGISGRPTIMPRLELLPALMMIPNITNANLSLNSFQVQNFLASMSMLQSNILESYKNQLIMESWRIAGHSDIFFNVFGIAETFGNGFKSMFYDPIKADVESPEKVLLVIKGGGQLIFGTLGSIIQGGEGFIKNVSNFLSMIDEDDANVTPTDNTNLNAADTFGEGISSFGNGLIEGISGLIKKPIEGGKKDGILGAVTGLAKGAIGAVTKPTAGFLDMSAGIIGGIRKTISINDGPIQRFREPNSYPFSIIGGFDLENSKMQAYAQKLNKKKKFYLMKLMAVNFDKDFAYALFDKRLFFFKRKQDDFEFYSKLNVNKIQNISREDKTVRFIISGKNKKIEFECMNQEMAEKFVIVLNSLVTYTSIFNE